MKQLPYIVNFLFTCISLWVKLLILCRKKGNLEEGSKGNQRETVGREILTRQASVAWDIYQTLTHTESSSSLK